MQQLKDSFFEMTDDELKKLNICIDKNIHNLRSTTDYALLYRIAVMMTMGLKIKDRRIKKLEEPMNEEKSKEISLQFFESLDKEFYEKAKKIIDGSSDTKFNIYQLTQSKKEEISETANNDMDMRTETPCVVYGKGKSSIYIPKHDSVEDIFLIVHEISHTFDLNYSNNSTRNILGEVTPYCFEGMLYQYLVQKGIISQEDAIIREKGNITINYDSAVETLAKLELIRIKQAKGKITQEDIIEMQKQYKVTNKQMNYILNRLVRSNPNVDYEARYIIAQLVYPHYMEQYNQNPNIAIQNLKQFFEKVKSDDFQGSIETLGIYPNLNVVSKLIEKSNKRIDDLEQTKVNDIEQNIVKSVSQRETDEISR